MEIKGGAFLMSLKKVLMYTLLFYSLSLVGCERNVDVKTNSNTMNNTSLHTKQEQENIQSQENEDKAADQNKEALIRKSSPVSEEEKIVTVGGLGLEEDVTLIEFRNEWISLWYDPILEIEEKEDDIRFLTPSTEATFKVEKIEKEWERLTYTETIVNDYNDKGYNLINQFELESKEGWGYIFYSYEKRHSVDVYFIDGKNKFLKIEFIVPDKEMEKYIMRFEYMLETIEVPS
jgi:hypothetical protein